MLVYDGYLKIHREETPTGQSLTDWNIGKNDNNFLKYNGRRSVNKTYSRRKHYQLERKKK